MNENARLTELWQRLLDNHRVSITEHEWHGPYGSHSYPFDGKRTDIDVRAEVERKPEHAQGQEWYELTLADYSDYGGSDLDAANVKTLGESFGCHTESIAYGGQRAYVILGEAWDPDRLKCLVDAIERLDDYPILDEEDYYAYIQGLTEEAWDQWIRLDFPTDAEPFFEEEESEGYSYSAYEIADEFFDANEDAIREAYYSYEGSYGWYAESATSVVNPNHKEAVEYAVREVRKNLTEDPNQLTLIAE